MNILKTNSKDIISNCQQWSTECKNYSFGRSRISITCSQML